MSDELKTIIHRPSPIIRRAHDITRDSARRNDWLIIFVKAPSAGEVKTRLLPFLSAEEACQLYRCLVLDTLELVKPIPNVHIVVTYAANAEFPNLEWLDNHQTMFLQHGRTLGERLIHAFGWAFEQQVHHVVVLGSDAPDLSTQWVRQAFQTLTTCDVVLGPTIDGGYHLVGLSKPHPELFVDMPWSSPQLLGRTLERIERLRLSVRALPPIADLDTPEDLRWYVAQERFGRRNTHTARYLTSVNRLGRFSQLSRFIPLTGQQAQRA